MSIHTKNKDKKLLEILLNNHDMFFNQGLNGFLALNLHPLTVNENILRFSSKTRQEYLQTKFNSETLDLNIQAEQTMTYQKSIEERLQVSIISWFWDIRDKFRNPMVVKLTPIINPETNKVICLGVSGEPVLLGVDFVNKNTITNSNILQLPPTAVNYKLLLTYNPRSLTHREHEILFLLYHNYIDKEIAYMLGHFYNKNITDSTIRNTINNTLFIKFGVKNRMQLKELAKKYYYHIQIPRLFIKSHYYYPDFIDLKEPTRIL